jgi:hypothetical protein
MANLTNVKIDNLAYDSSKGAANFSIKCQIDGTHASAFGSVPVKTPGDQKESEVRAASKAALADFLQALAAHVRSAP